MTEQETYVRDTLGNSGHPITVREIALASGVKLSTTRGILRRMLEAGEVGRDEDERYTMINEGATPSAQTASRSQQGEHDEVVRAAVLEHAGEHGLTITEISGLVNLRRRVCENTLWRLETKTGDLVSIGRPKRYLPHPAA